MAMREMETGCVERCGTCKHWWESIEHSAGDPDDPGHPAGLYAVCRNADDLMWAGKDSLGFELKHEDDCCSNFEAEALNAANATFAAHGDEGRAV